MAGSVERYEKSIVLIRLLVGWVFVSEGIQKFLFPTALGVGRFRHIGIPEPGALAPFVGTVEIVFGLLVVFGVLTRWAAIPLLGVISVALYTTKLPILENQGPWAAMHAARTDLSMLLGIVYLLIVGGGSLAVDRIWHRRNRDEGDSA